MYKDAKNKKFILDPRTKLFVLIVLSIGVTSNYNLFIMANAGIFLTFIYAFSGNLKGAAKIAIFYAAVLALNFYQIYYLNLKDMNPLFSIIMVLQAFIVLFTPTAIMANYFITTTPVSAVMGSLERLKLSQNIVIPIVIMLRFFPTLKESYTQIKNAMKMRGIESGYIGVLKHPVLTMEYVFVPILIAASNMSDELAASAYTRGADFKCKKVRFYESKFGFFDYTIFVFLIYYLFLVIKVRFL